MGYRKLACSSCLGWLHAITYEGGKVTLALKSVRNEKSITGIKEISFVVNNFDSAFAFMKSLNLKEKNKQQNYREEWRLGKVIFDLDTWPLIDPYLEVEGPNKKSVITMIEKLGYKEGNMVFGSSDGIYKNFYGMDILSKPELVF